jgi:acyl-CoA thioesterase
MATDDNDPLMGSSFFGRGTAVEAVGNGRYHAHLDEEWNCPIVPQGGITAATAARAIAAEHGGAEQPLRSLHVVFAGQVHAGPVEINVEVLRRGRSVSQLAAHVRNTGEPAGLHALAVHGAVRDGYSFADRCPPDDVPPADECPSFRDPPPDGWPERRFYMNFWDQVEGRAALGHAPWEEYEPDSSLRAAWYRFDDAPRGDDGTWDPLALVAICDTMPGSVSEVLGAAGRERVWLPPSTDLTVHVLDVARSDWVLGVNRAHHAADGYASLEQELWDLDGNEPKLVAYATQVMFFVFPDG